MDFGRAAIIRLEELENAVRQRRETRIRNTGFFVRPNFSLRDINPYRITAASGKGRQSLIVTLNLTVQTVGRVILQADSQRLGFSDFTTAGNIEQTIMLSTRFTDMVSLSLISSGGLVATINSIQVILIGDEASLSRRTCSFSSDESGNFLGVLNSKNDRIVLTRYLQSNLSSSQEFDVGTGSVADLCGDGQGGFFVFYSDTSQNNWVEHIAQNDNRRRTNLGVLRITACAIARVRSGSNNFLMLAYVDNTRVYTRRLTTDFSNASMRERLENEIAENVDFVKNTNLPDLLINRGGRIFLRRILSTEDGAETSLKLDAKLKARIRVRAEI